MAYYHQYVHRFETPEGWRWRLDIRPATNLSVTTYTDLVLPAEAVEVKRFGAKFPSGKPYGFAEAMTMTLVVELSDLVGDGDLEYLRDLLRDSCLISGSQIYLNTFTLTSDCGNATLAESAFVAMAVCAQKPTFQREIDASGDLATMDIEAFDVAKIVAEMTEIAEFFSLPGDASQVGTVDRSYTLFEWLMGSTNRKVIAPVEASYLDMRNVVDAMQTMARRVGGWSQSALHRSTVNWTTYGTFLSGKPCVPLHSGWQFYRYDHSQTNADVKVALDHGDLWYIADMGNSGFERNNTQYGPAQRWENWWNMLQDMTESFFAKGAFRWINDAGTVRPVVVYGSPTATMLKSQTIIDWNEIEEATASLGFEVLRNAVVKAFPRNKQQDLISEEDQTEWNHGSNLSIVDDEWGVNEVYFDNLPEARGHDGAGWVNPPDAASVAGFRMNRVWLNMLFENSEDPLYARIHHHVAISFLSDTVEGDDAMVTFSPSDSSTQQALDMKAIQSANGGLPGTLARAVYTLFGRRDQMQITATTELNADLMPMNLGETFTFTAPTSVEDAVGGLFERISVLTESEVDLETGSVSITFFTFGLKDPI